MVRAALIAMLSALVSANDRCQEYVDLDYCEQSKMASYMSKYCAGFCDSGADASEEDSACVKWAEEGYCLNEQFSAYMRTNCPAACGFEPEPDGSSSTLESNDGEFEEEDEGSNEVGSEEESTGSEEEESAADTTQRSSAPDPLAATSAGGAEPENCGAWARQGLCEGGAHAEYMQQNCPRACEDPGAAGGDDSLADPIKCAQWAIRGMCDEGGQYAQFMSTYCKEACEAEANRDPNAGTPPPADVVTVLIVIGFGSLVFYAVQRTMAMDSGKSLEVKKTLGFESTIGPGKVIAWSKSSFAWIGGTGICAGHLRCTACVARMYSFAHASCIRAHLLQVNKSAVLGAKTHKAEQRMAAQLVKRSAKKG